MSNSLWPYEHSPPGFSVHGAFQARILEWGAISFSRGIFLTQGSNLGLLHYRHILYCLSHQRPSGLKYYQNGEHDTLLKRIPIYQTEKRTALVAAGVKIRARTPCASFSLFLGWTQRSQISRSLLEKQVSEKGAPLGEASQSKQDFCWSWQDEEDTDQKRGTWGAWVKEAMEKKEITWVYRGSRDCSCSE